MNDKPDDDAPPDAAPAAPEVEAELVGDLGASDTAFDEPSPDEDSEAPPVENKTAGLTPGVIIFVIFAIVALAAFFVWRLQQNPKQSAPTPAIAVETPAPDPVHNDPAPAPVDEQPAAQEPVDDLTPGNTPGVDAAAKIGNAPIEAKPDLEDLSPGGAELFLPPVGSGGGNEDLQRAAKEALERFGPQADEDVEPVATPDDDNSIDGFELAPGEAAQTEEIAAPTEAPTDASRPAADQSSEPAIDAEDAPAAVAPEVIEPAAQEAAKIDNAAMIDERLKAANAALQTEIAGLRAENETLAARIAGLEAAVAQALATRGADDDARFAAIEAGLAKLQNSAPARPTNAQAVQLLARLGAALDTGAPFTEPLERLRPAAPAGLRLDHLSALAVSGAPTLASLKADFDDAARAGLAAANSANAPRGLSGLAARAQNLFSIRPATPTDGDSAGAIIARAEFALGNNELAAALGELADAPEPMRAAMAPWLARAQARAGAARELANLQEALLGAAIGN